MLSLKLAAFISQKGSYSSVSETLREHMMFLCHLELIIASGVGLSLFSRLQLVQKHFSTVIKRHMQVKLHMHGMGWHLFKLSDHLSLHTSSISLRSVERMLLAVPRPRGDRAFAVAAPRRWNKVPFHMWTSPALAAFILQQSSV